MIQLAKGHVSRPKLYPYMTEETTSSILYGGSVKKSPSFSLPEIFLIMAVAILVVIVFGLIFADAVSSKDKRNNIDDESKNG